MAESLARVSLRFESPVLVCGHIPPPKQKLVLADLAFAVLQFEHAICVHLFNDVKRSLQVDCRMPWKYTSCFSNRALVKAICEVLKCLDTTTRSRLNL